MAKGSYESFVAQSQVTKSNRLAKGSYEPFVAQSQVSNGQVSYQPYAEINQWSFDLSILSTKECDLIMESLFCLQCKYRLFLSHEVLSGDMACRPLNCTASMP
jgi:sigma54-dependent transcription regulator